MDYWIFTKPVPCHQGKGSSDQLGFQTPPSWHLAGRSKVEADCQGFPSHPLLHSCSVPHQALTSICSASQPSSLARREAMRRAKHFLPSKELPP